MKENKLESEPKDEQVERLNSVIGQLQLLAGSELQNYACHEAVELLVTLVAERDKAVEALKQSQDAYKRAERRTLENIAAWLEGLAKTERLKHQRNVASELAYKVTYELIPVWCTSDPALAASQPSMPEPQTGDSPPVTGDKT